MLDVRCKSFQNLLHKIGKQIESQEYELSLKKNNNKSSEFFILDQVVNILQKNMLNIIKII